MTKAVFFGGGGGVRGRGGGETGPPFYMLIIEAATGLLVPIVHCWLKSTVVQMVSEVAALLLPSPSATVHLT